MTIKTLRCTTIGIALALVITLIFNVSYWLTILVLNNPVYALNLAMVAVIIILTGVLIDIIKNIHVDKEKPVSDLKPQGIKTTAYPDDIEKDKVKDDLNPIQTGEEIGQQITGESQTFMTAEQNNIESEEFNKLIE